MELVRSDESSRDTAVLGLFRQLPAAVQQLADRSYETLRDNPGYSSLHLKKVGAFRSVRVGIHYRALAVEDGSDLVWVWIGTHAEYDQLIQGRN
jgi:hypothetical protein